MVEKAKSSSTEVALIDSVANEKISELASDIGEVALNSIINNGVLKVMEEPRH